METLVLFLPALVRAQAGYNAIDIPEPQISRKKEMVLGPGLNLSSEETQKFVLLPHRLCLVTKYA